MDCFINCNKDEKSDNYQSQMQICLYLTVIRILF